MALIPRGSPQELSTDSTPSTSKTGRVPTGLATEIVISNASFKSAHRAHERQQLQLQRQHDGILAGTKRKREGKGDSSVMYGENAYRGPWAKFEEHRPDVSGSEEDGSEVEIEYEEDSIPAQPSAPQDAAERLAGTAYEMTGTGHENTEFHGEEEFDYQGRTYMHVPQDLDIDLKREMPPMSELKNFVPKKMVHSWKHHDGKPVTQLRFFPDSGHLLLSSDAGGKIALSDIYHNRSLLRTYNGHTKSVADIDFSPDGHQFLSASYDRMMKLWDTETGKCLGRFSTGATPHTLRFNPAEPWEFIAGMSDKKIIQFDIRVATNPATAEGEEEERVETPQVGGRPTKDRNTITKPIQEYDHHLAPLNTLLFIDDSRRFLSTSDDKSLRAWEYNIPVPIKFIAEPYMFALTRSSLHPSGKHALFQSADNQIVVYGTEKFRQNRKKGFRGHNNAGYAVDVSVSPDGNIVASGDSGGYVCFWDWKTCKMWHKILVGGEKAGACTCVQWHPRETSKVATAGLDGVIRYWD